MEVGVIRAPRLRYPGSPGGGGPTHPGYGSLSGPMFQAIAKVVRDQRVWALYSGGGLTEARMLIRAGAAHVCAVDKQFSSLAPQYLPFDGGRIIDCRALVSQFLRDYAKQAPPDVVFMKWPDVSLRMSGELDTAPTVIYMGRNNGLTACGPQALWRALSYRPVQTVVEGPRNDLVVYGPRGDAPALSPRCNEEVHAWNCWGLGS